MYVLLPYKKAWGHSIYKSFCFVAPLFLLLYYKSMSPEWGFSKVGVIIKVGGHYPQLQGFLDDIDLDSVSSECRETLTTKMTCHGNPPKMCPTQVCEDILYIEGCLRTDDVIVSQKYHFIVFLSVKYNNILCFPGEYDCGLSRLSVGWERREPLWLCKREILRESGKEKRLRRVFPFPLLLHFHRCSSAPLSSSAGNKRIGLTVFVCLCVCVCLC